MNKINAPKILRRKQVEEVTGLSASGVYKRMDKKSPLYDPTFPRPISLGKSAVGWLDSEVKGWIYSRIALSRQEQQQ